MTPLQHYQGRLYKVEEILEVLAFLYGYLSVPEIDGRLRRRFPRSWRRRVVIQSCRQVSSGRHLGWGYDWKGVQVRRYEPFIKGVFVEQWRRVDPPEHCYPLKDEVRDYERKKMLPLKVIAEAAKTILERDKAQWVRYSVMHLCDRGLLPIPLPIAAE